MAQILFDKMLTVRKLEGEGQFTRRQAETLSEVMHDAMSAGVATKSDLSLTESALRADIEALKAEIGAVRHDLKVVETTLRSELKTEVAGLRGEVKADIAQATVQTIVWVGGIMVTLLVASGLMQHFLR